MTLPIAVLTTGRPVPEAEKARGRFFDMIRHQLASDPLVELVDFDCVAGQDLPSPSEVSGVIVTGSPARVAERAPWMLRTEEQLRQYAQAVTPVLGICFGHQLLGNALGGLSGPNPKGREIGTTVMSMQVQDALLAESVEGDDAPLVVMTHLDSVLRLPPGAKALARTQLEQHAAIRFTSSVWGVQFHPEMDHEIVAHYIEARRDEIAGEGADPDALIASLRPTKLGGRLLRQFVTMCLTARPAAGS